MKAAALAMAALFAAFWGFSALSLAMERHHGDSYGRGASPLARRGWLQAAGATGLALSLLACLVLQGPTRGWVLWCGVLTLCAAALVLVLSYAPRYTPRAGLVALAASVLAGLALLASG